MKRQIIIALALAAAVALGLIINSLIVTDRERIEQAVNGIRDGVARGNVEAIFSYVSSDYQDEQLSRTELRGLAERFFKANGPIDTKIRGLEVKRSGEIALAVFDLTVKEGGQFGSMSPSRWNIGFRKEGDKLWRVTKITPVRVGMQDVNGWDDIQRGAGL